MNKKICLKDKVIYTNKEKYNQWEPYITNINKKTGTVIAIDEEDKKAPYLIEFDNNICLWCEKTDIKLKV